MKNKLVLAVLGVLLVSCTTPSNNSNTSDSSIESSSISSSEISVGSSSNESSSMSSSLSSDSLSTSISMKSGTISIFAVNDFHGAVEETSSEPGLAKYAHALRSAINSNPDSVLLSAGDMFQGSALSNMSYGRIVVEAMNSLNFDAMAIGNHEFDWGVEKLKELKELANFPFLAANIVLTETNEIVDYAEPTTMKTIGDINVGIIGTIGSGVKSSISSKHVQDVTFLSQPQIVNYYAEELRSQGADIVILDTHESFTDYGSSQELQNIICQDSVVICNPSIDAIVTGHYHLPDAQTIHGVPVVQALSNGKAYGQIDLEIKNGDVIRSSVNVFNTTSLSVEDEDQSVKEIITKYENELAPVINEVVGTLTSDLSRYASYGQNISPYGQLVADELLEYGQSVDNTISVSLHNSGGIRDHLYQGEVTWGDIYKTLPFDNEMIIVEMQGSILKEVLKYYCGTNPYGGFRNVNGDYLLNGTTPIVSSQAYKLISIDYLTTNSSPSCPFLVYKNVMTFTSTNLITGDFVFVRDLVKNEFKEKGTINPANYADGR